MTLRNPAGAIGSRLNSANFEHQELSWLRKGITYTDRDLEVEQDSWHLEIEGKCVDDWRSIAKRRLKAASLDDRERYWDFYHNIYKKIPRGQLCKSDSSASKGFVFVYAWNHKRLRDGFTGVSITSDDSCMRLEYTGPAHSSLSDMAHPYVHTPLCFALKFFSRKVSEVAFEYLKENLSNECLVLDNFYFKDDFASLLFVYLAMPSKGQSITDIDNDRDAAVLTQGLDTHLATHYGRQTLDLLLELRDPPA